MTPSTGRIGWRERAYAMGALGCGVVLTGLLVGFVARNLGYLAVAVVSLGLGVAGMWWAVTERMPRRVVGCAGVALGVAGMAVALVGATPQGDRVAVRLVVLAVLMVGAIGLGRAALLRDLHGRDALRPVGVEPPRRPVLICNPWSGGGKVEKFGLAELARGMGVEVVMLDQGLDLEALARDAIARGADCLGMAGGDGSQALVASIAIEHDLPFVCVSAGTRNHFALDLGIDREDPRGSLDAFRDGVERRIDYATVGDRLFVNNVSLGIYATIVQQEGYREAKSETTRALLPEMLGRTSEPFDLQFTDPGRGDVDGAFLIQVSNNPYVLGATLDASQRRRLDTGRLGVVAVSAGTGAEAAQVLTLSALGQRRRSRHWHEFTAERFEVRSRSGKAYAGVDGEALELDTPLEFRIHPRGLRLLVPEGNLTAAEQRRARDIRVRDLVDIARGRDPLGTSEPVVDAAGSESATP
jgi:diacylglycerol kinase family enzyme